MERVKDFFFDLSDILISLLIIAVILFVVTWKLSDTMPLDFALLQADQETEAPTEEDKTPTIPIGTTENAGTPTEEVTQPTDATEPPPAETPSEPAPTPPVETVKVITVTIPEGSTGNSIAKILASNGLISDIAAFNKKVEDIGLGGKLRAGTFKLSTDMSDETIAKTISGQK